MSEKKSEFDFTNNYYLVVSRKNLKEVVSLMESIKNLSKKKKVIPEEMIDRFYSMMKPLRSVSQISKPIYNDEDIALRAFDVIEYIRDKREYRQYMFKKERAFIPFASLDGKTKPGKKNKRKMFRWYDGFSKMIFTIVEELIIIEALNKEEWHDKDFCIKEAYLLFQKYKRENMSIGQGLNYNKPYKFIALSAIVANKVFGFQISREKELTIWKYHQHALNALKKYNVRY